MGRRTECLMVYFHILICLVALGLLPVAEAQNATVTAATTPDTPQGITPIPPFGFRTPFVLPHAKTVAVGSWYTAPSKIALTQFTTALFEKLKTEAILYQNETATSVSPSRKVRSLSYLSSTAAATGQLMPLTACLVKAAAIGKPFTNRVCVDESTFVQLATTTTSASGATSSPLVFPSYNTHVCNNNSAIVDNKTCTIDPTVIYCVCPTSTLAASINPSAPLQPLDVTYTNDVIRADRNVLPWRSNCANSSDGANCSYVMRTASQAASLSLSLALADTPSLVMLNATRTVPNSTAPTSHANNETTAQPNSSQTTTEFNTTFATDGNVTTAGTATNSSYETDTNVSQVPATSSDNGAVTTGPSANATDADMASNSTAEEIPTTASNGVATSDSTDTTEPLVGENETQTVAASDDTSEATTEASNSTLVTEPSSTTEEIIAPSASSAVEEPEVPQNEAVLAPEVLLAADGQSTARKALQLDNSEFSGYVRHMQAAVDLTGYVQVQLIFQLEHADQQLLGAETIEDVTEELDFLHILLSRVMMNTTFSVPYLLRKDKYNVTSSYGSLAAKPVAPTNAPVTTAPATSAGITTAISQTTTSTRAQTTIPNSTLVVATTNAPTTAATPTTTRVQTTTTPALTTTTAEVPSATIAETTTAENMATTQSSTTATTTVHTTTAEVTEHEEEHHHSSLGGAASPLWFLLILLVFPVVAIGYFCRLSYKKGKWEAYKQINFKLADDPKQAGAVEMEEGGYSQMGASDSGGPSGVPVVMVDINKDGSKGVRYGGDRDLQAMRVGIGQGSWARGQSASQMNNNGGLNPLEQLAKSHHRHQRSTSGVSDQLGEGDAFDPVRDYDVKVKEDNRKAMARQANRQALERAVAEADAHVEVDADDKPSPSHEKRKSKTGKGDDDLYGYSDPENDGAGSNGGQDDDEEDEEARALNDSGSGGRGLQGISKLGASQHMDPEEALQLRKRTAARVLEFAAVDEPKSATVASPTRAADRKPAKEVVPAPVTKVAAPAQKNAKKGPPPPPSPPPEEEEEEEPEPSVHDEPEVEDHEELEEGEEEYEEDGEEEEDDMR